MSLISVADMTPVSGLSFQISGVCEEEAVRIFLEFERVESAIKGERINLKRVCAGGLYFMCPRSYIIKQVSV